MPANGTAKTHRQAGEAMRRVMQRMLFDSHPKQTLYSGLLDAMSIHGRKRRVVEDLSRSNIPAATC